MTAGEDFLRRCRKANLSYEFEKDDSFREAFFASLPSCPESLCWDLYEEMEILVFGRSTQTGLEDTLASVIDLMNGEYDPKFSVLDDDEITAVYEAVNDYASELPEELVFSVMQVAVERGLLG